MSAHSSSITLLPPPLQQLLRQLHERWETERQKCIEQRKKFQKDLPSPSESIRKSEWRVRPLPPTLLKRHVEITGPAEPKILIHALHSGADAFMADLEDAFTPFWENQLSAQEALYHASRGTLRYESPEGKLYQLDPAYTTLLLVRPRGLHLIEKHYRIHGNPISATFFDLAVYLYHNTEPLLKRGAGPYLYLPKIESRQEARLLADVLTFCEEFLKLPLGTVRVTLLIETFPAAFQMEEILYEFREHAAGLNAGRWDYLFSLIKTYQHQRAFALPEREKLTMDQPFLRAYAEEVVRAAHKRGALAIGGMSAFIPDRKNPELNAFALEQVRKDKAREIAQGYDGAWVAHPDLVPIVKNLFEEMLQGRPNQGEFSPSSALEKEKLTVFPSPEEGLISSEGIQRNIEVALLYLSAWLKGQGAVALFHLMEDAATAEISRSQLWQWLHSSLALRVRETQEPISIVLYETLIENAQRKFPHISKEASSLLRDLVYSPSFIPFFTSYAYKRYVP
ncbi:MAG: malate synthase [Bacteroidia bacterium]|nr:malate synthase [Bacteroidia bacterium]